MEYELVTLTNGTRLYLERPRVTEMRIPRGPSVLVLSGQQVDKEGDRLDKLRIIDMGSIRSRRPMRMNLFYGELGPVGGRRSR